MMKKYLLLLLFLTFNIQFNSHAFAENRIIGEIINVNQEYRIAFTDLSSFQLKEGEVVEIYKEGELLTHLEVSETSSVISKLMPIQKGSFFDTKVDFALITVGSTVVKKGLPDGTIGSLANIPETTGTLEEEFQKLSDKYVDLSVSLTEALNEKKVLQEENEILKEQLQSLPDTVQVTQADKNTQAELKKLRSTIAILKDKLKYMETLIEGNGSNR